MLKRIMAAGAFLFASAVTAGAADLPTIPTAPPPPPPASMAPAFDWSGPYVGAYGGAILLGPTFGQAGVQAGYNFTRGHFLAGIEVQTGAVFSGGGGGFEADLNARLGAILGERVLLYGEAGAGVILPGATPFWTAGGGVEVALGTATSVFAEAKALGAFSGGCCALVVQGGLNWHFGR